MLQISYSQWHRRSPNLWFKDMGIDGRVVKKYWQNNPSVQCQERVCSRKARIAIILRDNSHFIFGKKRTHNCHSTALILKQAKSGIILIQSHKKMHFRITLTVHNPHVLCSFPEKIQVVYYQQRAAAELGEERWQDWRRQCLQLKSFAYSSVSLARTCTAFGTSLKGQAPQSCNTKAVLCLFKQNSSSEAESESLPMGNLFTHLSDTSLSYVNTPQDCQSCSQSKSVILPWLASSQLQAEKNANQ